MNEVVCAFMHGSVTGLGWMMVIVDNDASNSVEKKGVIDTTTEQTSYT